MALGTFFLIHQAFVQYLACKTLSPSPAVETLLSLRWWIIPKMWTCLILVTGILFSAQCWWTRMEVWEFVWQVEWRGTSSLKTWFKLLHLHSGNGTGYAGDMIIEWLGRWSFLDNPEPEPLLPPLCCVCHLGRSLGAPSYDLTRTDCVHHHPNLTPHGNPAVDHTEQRWFRASRLTIPN